MKRNINFIFMCIVAMLMFVGCSSMKQANLIFASYTDLGIKASAEPQTGGGCFQLGYHDGNLAIIPVAVESEDGVTTKLGSEAVGKDENGHEATHKDSFSVVAQFDASSGGNPASKDGVNLGKTVATGSAAKVIADGIYYKLAGDNAPESE